MNIPIRAWSLLFAFSITCAAHAKDNKGVLAYYNCINKAEISICRNELQSALANYEKAYSFRRNKMYSKDLYNYFLVSAHLNRDQEEVMILKELRKRGWDAADFHKTIHKHFSAKEADKLAGLYAQLNYIKVELDSPYIKLLDSLVDIDQKSNKYLRSLNHGLLEGAGMDSMSRLTDATMQRFNELFTKKFPADDIIGREGIPHDALIYNVIFIHNAQSSNNHSLDGLLYRSITTGDFSPAEFAAHLSGYNMVDVKDKDPVVNGIDLHLPLSPYDFLLINDSLFQYPVNDSLVMVCNKNRKLIPGLDNAQEFREKLIFQYYNREYTFIINNEIVPLQLTLPPRIKKQLIYVETPKQIFIEKKL